MSNALSQESHLLLVAPLAKFSQKVENWHQGDNKAGVIEECVCVCALLSRWGVLSEGVDSVFPKNKLNFEEKNIYK